MSEQFSPDYNALPEQARIDLTDIIGAFMLSDEAHVVQINSSTTPTTLLNKAEVEGLITPFESLDIYEEVRQEFIDCAPSGLPKHR